MCGGKMFLKGKKNNGYLLKNCVPMGEIGNGQLTKWPIKFVLLVFYKALQRELIAQNANLNVPDMVSVISKGARVVGS